MMNLKKITALLLVLLLVLSVAGCSNSSDGGKNKEADYEPGEVVAKVGSKEITLDTLNQFLALNAYLQGYDMSLIEDEASQTYLQAAYLEDLINLQAVIEYCEQNDYDVLPDDYDDQLTAFLTNVSETTGEWAEANGITESFLTWYFTAQFYMDRVLEEVEADKDMDAEALAYYESKPEDFMSDQLYLTASHILLETEEEALAVRQLLLDGADFAETAAEYSIEPGAENSGGSLGTYYDGMMVEEFWEGSKVLAVDEISPPVQSQFGYHIIRMEDRMEEGQMAPFEEMKDVILNILLAELYYDRVEEIRMDLGVEYLLDGMAIDENGEPLSAAGGEDAPDSDAEPEAGLEEETENEE